MKRYFYQRKSQTNIKSANGKEEDINPPPNDNSIAITRVQNEQQKNNYDIEKNLLQEIRKMKSTINELNSTISANNRKINEIETEK